MNSTLRSVIIAIVFTAVGAFGYYAISPLFNNVMANDAVPGSAEAMSSDAAMMKKDGDAMTAGDAMKKDENAAQPSATNGVVTGTLAHPASGSVRIVSANGKNYVRYENLKTINGPAIHVYLAKSLDAKDHIDLGKVTATEGNVNYEIPAGVNVADYPYVLTWCEQFSVLFNSAKLQ